MTCIAIDADDVIFDTTQHILDYLNNYFMGSYSRSQFNIWDIHSHFPIQHQYVVDSLKLSKGWVESLPVRQDFLNFRNLLPDNIELYVVTSPNIKSDHWMIERTRALLSLGFSKLQIVQMSCKYKFDCDIFIDDSPSHVDKWLNKYPERKGFCLTYSNTKGLTEKGIEIESLSQVLEYL